jgi:hypothetical protein
MCRIGYGRAGACLFEVVLVQGYAKRCGAMQSDCKVMQSDAVQRVAKLCKAMRSDAKRLQGDAKRCKALRIDAKRCKAMQSNSKRLQSFGSLRIGCINLRHLAPLCITHRVALHRPFRVALRRFASLCFALRRFALDRVARFTFALVCTESRVIALRCRGLDNMACHAIYCLC